MAGGALIGSRWGTVKGPGLKPVLTQSGRGPLYSNQLLNLTHKPPGAVWKAQNRMLWKGL